MSEIILPRVYTKEVWERNGKVAEHKKYIGMFYISWSQMSTYSGKTGFSTGLLGRMEYIRSYFFGEEYEDEGYAQHGLEVEAFICYNGLTKARFNKLADNDKSDFERAKARLSKEELLRLKNIKPLGVFQKEIIYKFPDMPVILMGFSDDLSPHTKKNPVIEVLRDYKTKSEKSKKDLHKPETMQLELYKLGLEQDGYEVRSAEYCVIERVWKEDFKAFQSAGSGESDPQLKIDAKLEHLRVGERVWYEPYDRINDPERLQHCVDTCVEIVKQLAEDYRVYLKYFKDEKINF